MENKPWEEAQLASSSHAELYARRANATQEEQNKLAPYEHRAFAREAVSDNPLMAVPLAVAAPIYQASKAVGLESSRSKPSIEQVSQAYTGIGEGIAANLKKPWEEAKAMASDVSKSVSGAVESVKQAVGKLLPWEEAQQATKAPPPAAPKQINLNQGWDKINADFAAGKGDRDQMQLSLLQQELANEKRPKLIETLKREIKRVEDTINRKK